jgi:chromosome segregation ATPase
MKLSFICLSLLLASVAHADLDDSDLKKIDARIAERVGDAMSGVTEGSNNAKARITALESEIKTLKQLVRLYRTSLPGEKADLERGLSQIDELISQNGVDARLASLNQQAAELETQLKAIDKRFPKKLEQREQRLAAKEPINNNLRKVRTDIKAIMDSESESLSNLQDHRAFIEKRLKLLNQKNYGDSMDLESNGSP